MLSQFSNSENRSIAVEITSECLFISPQQLVALSVQQSVNNCRDRQSSDSATIGQSDSLIVTIVLTLVCLSVRHSVLQKDYVRMSRRPSVADSTSLSPMCHPLTQLEGYLHFAVSLPPAYLCREKRFLNSVLKIFSLLLFEGYTPESVRFSAQTKKPAVCVYIIVLLLVVSRQNH